MPAKKNYRKKKRTYKKKRQSRHYKPLQVARKNRVNWPLMPRTRLCKLRYSTRIQIDPMTVKTGSTDGSANNMARYTFVLNNLNDPDKTSNAVTHLDQDGMVNHQPRMYDQWKTFYEYHTVVGSKAMMTFTTRQQAHLINTNHGAGDSAVTAIPCIKGPEPCVVGYLKQEYEHTAAPAVRLDDTIEKNLIVYRKTRHTPGTYHLTKKWSLKKDPLYKTELIGSGAGGSDVGWGSTFDHNINDANKRYLHIVAHPLTTTDDVNPGKIDVQVNIDYIVLMSDLKDIGRS